MVEILIPVLALVTLFGVVVFALDRQCRNGNALGQLDLGQHDDITRILSSKGLLSISPVGSFAAAGELSLCFVMTSILVTCTSGPWRL